MSKKQTQKSVKDFTKKSPVFWTKDDFEDAINDANDDKQCLVKLARNINKSLEDLKDSQNKRIAKNQRTISFLGEDDINNDLIALCEDDIAKAQEFLELLQTIEDQEFSWTEYMAKGVLQKLGELL